MNFTPSRTQIKIFKPPKILGDVFESLIGAIFIDGGIQALNRVMERIFGPLILFVAQFSKEFDKEPIDDLNLIIYFYKEKGE